MIVSTHIDGFFAGNYTSANEVPENKTICEILCNNDLFKPYFNGTEWIETATPEEIQEFTNARVPQILTPRQFWLSVFTLKGLKKQDILNIAETLTEPPRELAKITLLESLQFERNDKMLIDLTKKKLSWTDEDLNEIFTFGDTL